MLKVQASGTYLCRDVNKTHPNLELQYENSEKIALPAVSYDKLSRLEAGANAIECSNR